MNELGLGVMVSMKDMFTRNSQRIQHSMMKLDSTVSASSVNIQRNMGLIQKGTMAMGAGLALLAIPMIVIASTVATQKALGEMASLGVKDLRSLSKSAEEFSNTWGGTTKAEFIAAAYDIKSGVSTLTDSAVGEFTKLAALTAKATKSTVAEMTSLFATGYGIYRKMYSDMSDFEFGRMFSGGIAASVQAFKTTGAGMASAISNLGATATSANIPLEEQLAILGMLQATMPGSEAGNKYRAFLKSAAEAGKELNIQFTDQYNNLLGVTEILKKLRAKYGDTLDAVEKMEIQKAFGRFEAVAFVDLLYNKVGDLTSNIKQMNLAMRTGTKLTIEMAQAMNMDIGSQFALVSQQVHNLFEVIGETMIPVLNPLIRGLSTVILWFQKMAKASPGLTRGILTFVSVLGALLFVAGGLMVSIGSIGILLPAIKAGLVALGAITMAGLLAAGKIILIVVGAIGLLIGICYVLKKAWEKNFGGVRDFILGVYTRVKLVFQGLYQLISNLSGSTSKINSELVNQLKSMGLWGFVKTVFMVYYRIREYLIGFWTAISNAFKKVYRILEPTVKILIKVYSELALAVFSVFEIFGIAAKSADGSTYKSLGETIGTLVGIVAQVGAYIIKHLVYNLAIAIRFITIGVRIIVWFTKVFVSGIIWATKFVYKFFLPLRLMIQWIKLVAKVAYTLWQVLTGDISVVDGLKKIGLAIYDFLGTPFRWARDVVYGFISFIKSLFRGVVAFIKNVGNAVVSYVMDMPLVSTFVKIIKNVRAFFAGDKTFYEAGKGIVKALCNGVWSVATLPFRIVKRVLSFLRKLLPFSDAKTGPLSDLTSSGKAIITTLCRGMLSVARLPIRIISGIFGKMLSVGKKVWSGVGGFFSKSWDWIKGKASGIWGHVKNIGAMSFDIAKSSVLPVSGVGSVLPVSSPSPILAGATSGGLGNPSTTTFNTIERTKLLASKSTTINNNSYDQSSNFSITDLVKKLDEIADRPVDVNVSVVSKLDGRIIAEAVYKNIRQQKIKNYETL